MCCGASKGGRASKCRTEGRSNSNYNASILTLCIHHVEFVLPRQKLCTEQQKVTCFTTPELAVVSLAFQRVFEEQERQ